MLATLSSDGRILNQGSVDLIQELYRGILLEFERAIEKYSPYSRPRSVYVRGSVAVGRAIEGLSDIDLVVVYDRISKKEINTYRSIAAEIARKHNIQVDDIDITITTLPALLYDEQIKNLKIYLKYQSVLLCGEDILNHLPDVYPGVNLALFMYGDIESELVSLERQFKKMGSPKKYQSIERPTRFWCVWMARTVLRSGMALAMSKSKTFSQDLLECRDLSIESFPDLKDMMETAITLAVRPTNSDSECIDFLKKYSNNYIKLWNALKETQEKNYE